MRALQTAVEMYYADNGTYPGATHYSNFTGGTCGAPKSTPVRNWTEVFTPTFVQNYLGSLPNDPKGSEDFCYSYSSSANSTVVCNAKDGTIFDIDGINAGGQVTGPLYKYMLTFRAEGDLHDKYLKYGASASTDRYCILGGA